MSRSDVFTLGFSVIDSSMLFFPVNSFHDLCDQEIEGQLVMRNVIGRRVKMMLLDTYSSGFKGVFSFVSIPLGRHSSEVYSARFMVIG